MVGPQQLEFAGLACEYTYSEVLAPFPNPTWPGKRLGRVANKTLYRVWFIKIFQHNNSLSTSNPSGRASAVYNTGGSQRRYSNIALISFSNSKIKPIYFGSKRLYIALCLGNQFLLLHHPIIAAALLVQEQTVELCTLL